MCQIKKDQQTSFELGLNSQTSTRSPQIIKPVSGHVPVVLFHLKLQVIYDERTQGNLILAEVDMTQSHTTHFFRISV